MQFLCLVPAFCEHVQADDHLGYQTLLAHSSCTSRPNSRHMQCGNSLDCFSQPASYGQIEDYYMILVGCNSGSISLSIYGVLLTTHFIVGFTFGEIGVDFGMAITGFRGRGLRSISLNSDSWLLRMQITDESAMEGVGLERREDASSVWKLRGIQR